MKYADKEMTIKEVVIVPIWASQMIVYKMEEDNEETYWEEDFFTLL